MGLDVYASRTPWQGRDDEDVSGVLSRHDRRAFRRAKIDLGQFAEPGTFWGRDYFRLVRCAYPATDIFDEDVPTDLPWINAATVRKIAKALEACDPQQVAAKASSSRHEFTVDHVEGFRRFFRVCAKRGLGLIYWS